MYMAALAFDAISAAVGATSASIDEKRFREFFMVG
jgi:hypothetical protein